VKVRPPAVAGSFYPADPHALAATVDSLLATASAGGGDPVPAALVVPHAGYVYSGPVAASAYSLLRGSGDPPGRVAVLGPAHFADLDGLAAPTCDELATPLGRAGVDTGALERLVEAELASFSDVPHVDEHSIEVQLPFLQCLLGDDATYAPLAVGRADPCLVADALDLLGADLVVVSTDLSHYLPHDRARRQDRRTAEAVVARRAQDIGNRDACGRHPLRGLLAWTLRHDLAVDLLDLRTSADTAGDPRRVVGYGAFAVSARPRGG
jgi:AmmeMemoRadiSam system protein B